MNPTLLRVATHLAQRDRRRRPSRRVGVVAAVAAAGAGATLVGIMLLGMTAVGARAPAVAGSEAAGIPPVVFAAYLAAETNANMISGGCVVDWPVIAGIWKVESGHATYGGATIDPTGRRTPPIYGPTLDGTTPGTQIIADTDGGALDQDPTWDRAVGPAQFLPSSWRAYGQDGNGDGTANPHNVYDAALATAAYLCGRTPGDYHDPGDLARAIRGYNRSDEYVAAVVDWVAYYRAFAHTAGQITADGQYAFPLPPASVTLTQIRATHHDYPASDLAIPEGTPVFAAHPGTVTNLYSPCPGCTCGWGLTVTGLDSHRYTYCHGQALAAHLETGSTVAAGETVMASGNTGNSTGPHLHLQIRNPAGDLICPQPLLEAWWTGVALTPGGAPTGGCTH